MTDSDIVVIGIGLVLSLVMSEFLGVAPGGIIVPGYLALGIHDPLADFQQVSRAERRFYRFEVDCHLTPSAHEVLARSIARTIEPLMAKSR